MLTVTIDYEGELEELELKISPFPFCIVNFNKFFSYYYLHTILLFFKEKNYTICLNLIYLFNLQF